MKQDGLGWEEMSKIPLILAAGGCVCHAGTVRVMQAPRLIRVPDSREDPVKDESRSTSTRDWIATGYLTFTGVFHCVVFIVPLFYSRKQG